MKTKSSLRLPFFNLPVLICFALFWTLAICAYASTITVTTTNDSGPGSLRQALVDANDSDTIAFAVTGTIGLTSGELAIDKNVTITGPGPDRLAVSGSFSTFRVFHIMPGRTVNIEGLTVTFGFAQFDVGGGILNDHAILTLTNCSVATNGAFYGGGGIYNDGAKGSATLTIIDSSVTGNGVGGSSPADGGGIYNNGAAILTISNSTISGNSAIGDLELSGGGGGIAGGGTIINSTIAGNHAALQGGGIEGGGTIINCTIRNNSAGGGENNRPGIGGGIYGGGTITNCTISGNSVFGNPFKGGGAGGGICSFGATIVNSTVSDNTVAYGDGGAIYNNGALTLGNNTFSNNSATQGGGISNGNLGSIGISNTILDGGATGENIFNQGGTISSAGYNLSSDDGGGYLSGPGDQINTDPLLGPLQDNGGPTFTHELLAGSPAIDAGDPSFTPPPWYDQRGPAFYRLRNNRIEIGSFEVQEGPAVTPTPTPTPTPTATPTPTPRPAPTTRPQPTPLPRPTPR
jgi:hypothetical protein